MTIIGHVLPLPFSCGDLIFDGQEAVQNEAAEAVQRETGEAVQIEKASKHVRSAARCGASILRDTRPRSCGMSSRVRHPVPSGRGGCGLGHRLARTFHRTLLAWYLQRYPGPRGYACVGTVPGLAGAVLE